MLRKSKSLLTVALTTLFFAAAPAEAQGLVGIGAGSYDSPSNPGNVSRFSYFLTDRGNGEAGGLAVWVFPAATFVVRVSSFASYEWDGIRSLAFAGTIVAIFGTPRGGATVGQTAFTAMRDNGRGSSDATVGFTVVPAQFGNPTIQQIIAINGPPPPQAWRPLLSGNIWTR